MKGGHWNIKFDKNVRDLEPIKIYISLAQLDLIGVGGKGTVECTNHFNNLSDMSIGIGGHGEVTFKGDANEISCSIGGMGTIKMSGVSEYVDINIGGKGKVWASDMETKKCDVSCAGNSQIEIHVKDYLDVSMVGNGSVHYKGSPKVSSSVIGSGDISKLK